MAQSGFVLYVNDWIDWTADYSDEETGIMLKALLKFFTTGEITTFDDRGMRQFFRQGIKAIELDRKSYDDKCLHNAHNRYKGECKKNGIEPLEFEEWLTTVDNRQGASPKTTNNNINFNSNSNFNNNSNSSRSAEGERTLSITEALEQGKITEAEAVSLRLRGYTNV